MNFKPGSTKPVSQYVPTLILVLAVQKLHSPLASRRHIRVYNLGRQKCTREREREREREGDQFEMHTLDKRATSRLNDNTQ